MISMTRHVDRYQSHRLISSLFVLFCRCRTSEKLIHLLKIHVVPCLTRNAKVTARRPSSETGSALLRKSSSDVLKGKIIENFIAFRSIPVASFFELMTGEFETLGLVDFPGFSGTFEFLNTQHLLDHRYVSEGNTL